MAARQIFPPPSPRFCGGLYLDIKRKLPWFLSDFYEGFHIQSISAILFIYLGCITNAITFGGLLGDATDNYQVKCKLRSAPATWRRRRVGRDGLKPEAVLEVGLV